MDQATLDEANRLRVDMGLKPLPIIDSTVHCKSNEDGTTENSQLTLSGRQMQAYGNYKKMQDEESTKRKREEKAKEAKSVREKAQRHAILEGATMGEADGDDSDVISWLRGQRKRQKKIKKDVEVENEAMSSLEKENQEIPVRDAESSSIKVRHDMAVFTVGIDKILTLKDTTVLENEGDDELENLESREREELLQRLSFKKGLHTEDPVEETGGPQSVLGQYNDNIYGKIPKTFTLDPTIILRDRGGLSSTAAFQGLDELNSDAKMSGSGKRNEIRHIFDDILSGSPSSDYIDALEIKVKKQRKSKDKKTTKTRKRGALHGGEEDILFPARFSNAEEPVNGNMTLGDVNTKTDLGVATERISNKKSMVPEDTGVNLIHDDEKLQMALAAQRREALKRRKQMRPEDLARILCEESSQPEGSGICDLGQPEGLMIDETAEFISNLNHRGGHNEELPRKRDKADISSPPIADQGISDDHQTNEDAVMQDWLYEKGHRGDDHTGLEGEKKISEGMGATLAILRGRGILDREQYGGSGWNNGTALNSRMRAHQRFVADKKLRLARLDEEARRRREQDRASGGAMSRLSVREREEYARRQNTHREFQTSRMLQDMFIENYVPNFQIEYTDEHGRSLNQKEAFRELSHGFHGKTSGRGKTDKMLKRIAAEKRYMAEGILDASKTMGISSATQQQLKKRKEAGVRLD